MRRADPDRVLRDLGRRVAELRRERGMTQDSFAEQWDVSVGYVRRVEAGANLSVRSLVTIAHLLGVQLQDLFDPPKDRRIRRGRPRARA
jgi:transcriptional regulator with XRE-family HTH domain